MLISIAWFLCQAWWIEATVLTRCARLALPASAMLLHALAILLPIRLRARLTDGLPVLTAATGISPRALFLETQYTASIILLTSMSLQKSRCSITTTSRWALSASRFLKDGSMWQISLHTVLLPRNFSIRTGSLTKSWWSSTMPSTAKTSI